jgi:hypothetical protein
MARALGTPATVPMLDFTDIFIDLDGPYLGLLPAQECVM